MICAVILACFAVSGATNENNLKFVAACGGNSAFKEHQIGSPSTAYSAIECGTRCSREERCHSYTFNKYSRLCHLSSAQSETCDHVAAESGSKYMKVVSFVPVYFTHFYFHWICFVINIYIMGIQKIYYYLRKILSD